MRSRNVCLTQMGADPGRVKDRRMEERGDRRKTVPTIGARTWKGRLGRGGVGILIPSQGQTAIGLFSGVGGIEICERTYNAEKEKQRTRGGKADVCPAVQKGVEKSMGANSKEGGRDELCYHKPRGTAGVMWTLQLDREPREIAGPIPVLPSGWSLEKKIPSLRKLLQAALSQTPLLKTRWCR